MDPLATYLLSVMKRQATCETRAFMDADDAIQELGYWTLPRPAGYKRGVMPPTNISQECEFIEEFPSYQPPSDGTEGYNIVVEVYADLDVVNGETT